MLALLHLLVLGAAPVADAILEQQALASATALAPSDSQQPEAPPPAHDESNCIFCTFVRAPLELGQSPQAPELRLLVTARAESGAQAQTPPQLLFLSVAQSRAPPHQG